MLTIKGHPWHEAIIADNDAARAAGGQVWPQISVRVLAFWGGLEPVGDWGCLKVTHDQVRDGANDKLYGGWPMILSGLKTWLETGELLTTPGSLMYTGQ